MKRSWLVGCGAMAMMGCAGSTMQLAPSSLDTASERVLLMRVDAEFSKMSVEKGASAAFAAYLSDDAKSINAGQVTSGRDAIVADLKPPPNKSFVLRWQPDGSDIAASGDFGYTFGSYDLESANEAGAKTVKHGKYVTIWKRAPDKTWKIALDTGNALPTPPAPTPALAPAPAPPPALAPAPSPAPAPAPAPKR
jgi:ketosteroid isomerase-like protein